MPTGGRDMKLLKTEDNLGFYLCKSGNFDPIDKITKEDLLRLVDLTLQQEVEFDEYDENTIKNEAHRIVYKNIVEKLQTLQERKQEFVDQSERLFLQDYEKYRDDSSQPNAETKV